MDIARVNHPQSPVVEYLNSLDHLHHTNQASKFHIIKNNLFARLNSNLSLLKEWQRIKNTSKKRSSSYLIIPSTIYFYGTPIDDGFIFWEECIPWKTEEKQPSKITSFKKVEAKQAKQKPYSFCTNGYLDPGKEARKSRSLNPKPFRLWSMGPSMGPPMRPSMGPSMNWILNS